MTEITYKGSFPDIKDIKHIGFAMMYSTDLISSHSANGTFTYVSPACLSLLGYPSSELAGRRMNEFCHPLDRENVKAFFSSAFPASIFFRFKRKEGDYVWLESSGSKTMDNQEVVLISRDITQRIIKEEKIMQNQKRDRLFLEHSKDTMGIITQGGIWTYINNWGKKLLGASSFGEIVGTSLYEYADSDFHPELKKYLSSSKCVEFEMSFYRKDQEIKKGDVQLIPTEFNNRPVILIMIRDITEHKKTEEQLEVAEKLSVMGQMAAGIAHEIRNPLTAIKGFTQLQKEAEDKYAEIILEELSRIESFVSDLLVLAKPQDFHLTHTNLTSLIKETVTFVSPQAIMHDVVIDYEHQDPIYIDCDQDKIKQVLLNIIQNSIEAMEKGGIINVVLLEENRCAVIKVIDQGIGIPADRIKKLGEPFYSTKEKGTGLGLMISQKIIKNHSGTIEFSSRVNEGTTVTITLPVA
ncbi:PAS domain S-box protein [Bacillus sp. T33-2]|uniref:PAS domain S-box protein n=1 Tax=Bacillus sp. T33-2 TaxID=2054168 RepID=UPI000C76F925|nr:PAS domain S-box protein [Bacillus sp. T33-2]PLR95897.1 PAS domain-containing sensor histidine kinase [Bacillus sp. T33-2]